MLNFFKRRRANRSRGFLEKSVEPYVKALSTATAYAEAAAEYASNVEKGRISCPAHQRARGAPRSSVAEIWNDLRIETVARAIQLGAGSLFTMAEFRNSAQIRLLDTLFSKTWWASEYGHTSERNADLMRNLPDADIEIDNPLQFNATGNEICDSLRCIAQAYSYLGTAGTEVCDRLCDLKALLLKAKPIYDDFLNQAKQLQRWWAEYEALPQAHVSARELMLKRTKRTVLDIFIDDITVKTKSVALSVVFGPYYESIFKALVQQNRHPGDDDSYKRLMRTYETLIAAENPEELFNAED